MVAALPQWLETFAVDVAALWPLYLLVGALVTTRRSASKLIAKTVLETTASLDSRLESIEKEFHPNGGSSMRDLQDRTATSIARVASMVKVHDAALDVMWETSDHALWTTGPDVMVNRCNQAYLDLWGFESVDQAYSGEWFEMLTPASQAVVRNTTRSVSLSGGRVDSLREDPREWTFDADLKDGRHLRFIGRPIQDTDGSFEGYAGVVLELGQRN